MISFFSYHHHNLDSQSDIRIKRDINMDNMRIVQKNLVFVSSLPTSIADA